MKEESKEKVSTDKTEIISTDDSSTTKEDSIPITKISKNDFGIVKRENPIITFKEIVYLTINV
jgi:hypothetical protein